MAQPTPAGSGWHEDLTQPQPTPPPRPPTHVALEVCCDLGKGVQNVFHPNLPFLLVLKLSLELYEDPCCFLELETGAGG